MKNGIVIVPFVDSKTGTAYQINDEIKENQKRFEELLKLGLISDGKISKIKEVSEETEESVEPEEGKEEVSEETENNDSNKSSNRRKK